VSLPTGLSGAFNALGNYGDSHLLNERLITLIWLRLLTDPTAPKIGGNDPRRILDPELAWEEVAGFEASLLHVLCSRLNTVMGEELLHEAWADLPPPAVAKSLHEIGRWKMEAGDPLGAATMLLMSEGSKSARGAFYTPYSVSLMMAMMVDPGPGESVCDPCCGSGGMLLAALDACRTKHGPDSYLEVYGVDIDPGAVRLCRLNLVLAGIAPHPVASPPRVWERDALRDAPPALAAAVAQHEEQLGLFEAK
jgi:hypothetical protein